MKFAHVVSCIPLLTSAVLADPVPQSQISFTRAGVGAWNADWQGVENRVYTIQWSHDLINWSYAPFFNAGAGAHRRNLTSTAPKFFIRLMYSDIPGIESNAAAETADFDFDGIPNAWEITNSFDPFAPQAESIFLAYLASQPASAPAFELYLPLQ